jgi:Sec-independent protein translocase protein TatA
MGSFGTTEIILIVAVLFLLFGASRLPATGENRSVKRARHLRTECVKPKKKNALNNSKSKSIHGRRAANQ